MDPASDRVRAKLQFGVLPSADPSKTWLGPGTGSYCDGCDVEIPPGQAEVEIIFVDGETLRLHETCAEIWVALKGDLVHDAAADLERRDRRATPRTILVGPRPLSSSA